MSDAFTIDTSEIDKLLSKLHSYEFKVVNTASWRAIRAGAKVAKKAIQDNAPVRTGALSKSAYVSNKRGRKNIRQHGKVGLRVALKAVKLRQPKTGRKRKSAPAVAATKRYYAGYVAHGTKRTKAVPFVDAAFRSNKENIASAVVSTLEQELKKYI
jgi:HK97 gp10 family phage protein